MTRVYKKQIAQLWQKRKLNVASLEKALEKAWKIREKGGVEKYDKSNSDDISVEDSCSTEIRNNAKTL